jgi:hypothetical protein
MHGVQPVVYLTRTRDRGDNDICGSRAMAQSPPQPFPPTPPPPDKFDWIQLTSDEWLKGEFIALYDDVREFDSKELDELTLDYLWGRSTSLFRSSGIACRIRVGSRLVSSRKKTTTG